MRVTDLSSSLIEVMQFRGMRIYSWISPSHLLFSKLDLFCIISDKVKLNNGCLSSKDAI